MGIVTGPILRINQIATVIQDHAAVHLKTIARPTKFAIVEYVKLHRVQTIR